MLRKYGWLVLIATFALVFWFGKPAENMATGGTIDVATQMAESEEQDSRKAHIPAALPDITTTIRQEDLPAFLPDEASTTLELIKSRGPFPHRQDGVTFQNREKRLPQMPRGYYREYTVETPGLGHRGARRIITGGDPVEIYYYTADHYDSFREFEVQP